MEDRVMLNNSQGKKQEVEDHRRNVKLSNNKTSVTACNDSLNAKTSNVNFICVTCGKCVLNDNHDKCILHYLNGVNSRTKMPMAMPISTREPKCIVNQSVATSLRRIVASESTNQKPRLTARKLYEHVSKACSWWYPKFTPPEYKWKPKSQIGNVNPYLVEIILFIVDSRCSKHMTGNLKLLTNFVEKFMGLVKFSNDQIAPILGYGDLVQGTVTIKRVYYVKGLNHNLFSVGQFCNADLEVAFRKSMCYICDLKENDLLTGSRGTDLYSITLQDTSSPNLICLMAKVTSDGENLDKMKEKGDACIFVGYSTQSRAYRVFNKRKRVIVNFDKLLQMASDHVSSDPVPQCQRTALEHDSLSPGPQSQENLESDGEMYMFALTVSRTEPKNIREAMVDSACIESMQEELHQFDRLDIYQSLCGIFINQAKYAQEILIKHGMTSCDSIGTPMATKHLDADLSETSVDQTKYQSMEGALMYLTTSRPDIVHATCYCARYQAKPIEKHIIAVKRIFWYLKDTIHMGLWYLKDTGFELTAFSDSNHAGCLDSRKSTSGGIQFLGGDKLVSWSSKNQDCTTMSSAEAEYVSLSTCCAQVLWLRTQLTDYGFYFDKIPMYCESKAAIAISCNPVQHSRTKHIDVRYHFIKEKVENGIVELLFVETEYQLADLFTKALSGDRFKYLISRLGMRCLTPEELKVLANESA
nr:retrovirus-related Pol polyprotein from transposon TNT 1-94 [Tanacetum cinerariifolium]